MDGAAGYANTARSRPSSDGATRKEKGEPMDRYTKCVLTVIAVALCAIAVQNRVSPARAVGEDCGQWHNPCQVEVRGAVPVTGTVSIGNRVEVFGSVQTR